MTERITFVELDLRRCSLTYSESPCTAALGVTGDKKCFNSFGTCQDKENFADEIAVARYSTATSTPPDIDSIPSIQSVSIRPAKLELGESIGIRASINITFKDSRYPDTGPEGDRYLVDRDYDPFTQGTYWGKFRARFPFVRGSNIRLIRGSTDQSLAQMETRHFIVEKVAGPNSDGSFTIQCKDVLNLAKGKQAQAPILSNGSLTSDLNDTTISIQLSPAGIGNAEYPSSGLINLGGKELCTFTRSADFMTIVRGTIETTGADAVPHKAGVRVQLCLQFSIQKVSVIIEELLETFAGIDSNLIPNNDWLIEDDTYIDRNYSGIIAEPTAVDKLINELLVQTASTIWWDDINQLIQFRVLRSVDSSAAIYTDDIIKKNTFSAKDQPNKRVSQVWTYFAQINPLEKLDETQNYSSTIVTASPESEANFDGEKSIRRIFSRWIPLGSDAASRLNLLILSRYTTPPRLISFALQRDNSLVTPELGGGYNCQNFTLQTDEGATETVPIQILQVKSSDSGFSVIGEEVLYSETIAPPDPTIKDIPIDTSQTNLDLFVYATNAGFTFNSGDTANFTVFGGVIIDSASIAVAAMNTSASWPVSVTLNVINNGQIIGKAGNGGRGGNASVNATGFDPIAEVGQDGTDGGMAIELEYELNITNNGVVGGGGGGGGAGASDFYADSDLGDAFAAGGGGGGGGAGKSFGGAAGTGVINGFPSSLRGVDGQFGQGGSVTVRGTGGDGGIAGDIFKGATGGTGGDGGVIGSDGANGEGTVTFEETNPTQNQPVAGGAGGTSGLGVLTNGNTLNLTGNAALGGVV